MSDDPSSTPEAQLAAARQALAPGEYESAEDLASDWLDQHDRHPLLPEAYLIRGDALAAQGDEYEALYDYEMIARTFAGSEAFTAALEREFEIARQYAQGRKRKLFGMRIIGAEDEAQEIFMLIQSRLPGSPLAEKAVIELGDYYFNRNKMTLAIDTYEKFIELYPQSEHIPKARRRVIYAHLSSFRGPEYDAAGMYEARAGLQGLQAIQPAQASRAAAEELLAQIDEADASKMLQTARWYWRVDNPIAAELTVRRLIETYPRCAAAAEAISLAPEILPHLPQRVIDQAPDYKALAASQAGAPSARPSEPKQ